MADFDTDFEHNAPASSSWKAHEWDIDFVTSTPQPDNQPEDGLEGAPEFATPETAEADTSFWDSVWWSTIREILETLVMTVVIFALIRIPTQTFRVEGYSMEPNFHAGQYIIVNKAVYWFREPRRGEVVVFQFSDNPPRDYIKRVIGLPGETVEVRNGQVYINGRLLEEPWQPNMGSYSKGPVTLGPNEYFVLGDNRNNSSDSHNWGPLDGDRIIGQAWITYWPPKLPQVDAQRYPALAQLLERIKAHLSYREPRYWGLIPTYPDPLASEGGGS